MWTFLYKMASPQSFYRLAGRLLPWFTTVTLLLFAYGLLGALVLAPPDYQQGDAFRVIYLHVPSAILSLTIFTLLAFCAVLVLIWKIKLADLIIKVAAPIGAWMTFLALVTGAIWGKPMWGTWWIWDARLTSELILLFLYFGVIALRNAIPNHKQAARAVAILVLLGFLDIPIIHYSVNWWNTLHQGSSLSLMSKPTIAASMLYPLLAMIAAFYCYFVSLLLSRTRTEVLSREKGAVWVREIIQQEE